MSNTGDPGFNWTGTWLTIFTACQCSRYLEPEAYGRIGDWERVKPGASKPITRAMQSETPVVWQKWAPAFGQGQYAADRKADSTLAFIPIFIGCSAKRVATRDLLVVSGRLPSQRTKRFRHHQSDGTDRAITKVIREEGPFSPHLATPANSLWN